MKTLTLLLAATTLAANASETKSVTTTEKQTPVSCHRDGDHMVCTTSKITVVTVTISQPIPKRKKSDSAIGDDA